MPSRRKEITALKRSTKVLLIILVVLIIDQTIKFLVKTNMYFGQEIKMLGLDWARIHFTENPGMAFGVEIGGQYGKLALSLFRILAVGFLVYYLRYLLRLRVPMGLLVSFALILAGAIGNIIDSAFYGLIFSDSYHSGAIASLFPAEGGYAGFLHGRVVDMFHFPIMAGTFPDWVPVWGGEDYMFFRPVFNIADTSITIGVLYILLFQRSFFSGPKKPQEGEAEVAAEGPAAGIGETAIDGLGEPHPNGGAENGLGIPEQELPETETEGETKE